MDQYGFVIESTIAGIIASVACGLGALPLAFRGLHLERRIGLGYGLAGGLMFAASVYNLLLPAFTLGASGATRAGPVLQTIAGMAAGCAFLWAVERQLSKERIGGRVLSLFGSRTSALVFIAMAMHSIPEGVAVGVGFGSEAHLQASPALAEYSEGLGRYIAIAISIHNIPEGLAVALPLRAAGASISRCFFFAFLTSLPQPIAAIPASLLVSVFEPLMLPFLGFAAGAMMYLVLSELVPDSLETRSRGEVAWSFMIGFALMVVVQIAF